jgi:hypothetical protein
MRVTDIINESAGGLYRRGQEVEMGGKVEFANAQKQAIQLLGTHIFPPEGQDAYEPGELEQVYTQHLTDAGVDPADIHVVGNSNNAGAAMVTTWHDVANDKTIAYVKLVKGKAGPGKAAPVMWSNSDFKKASGGYGAQTKVAQRATTNLKPNKTVQTNAHLSVDSIAESVKTTVAGRQDLDPALQAGLSQLVDNVANGITDPIPGLATFDSSIQVDFGEVAAPVALIKGTMIAGPGYKLAEKALLGTRKVPLTWQSLSEIEYPNAGNENLYDSYIHVDENTIIKVSSKDKKGGAAASVAGIVQEIARNPEKFQSVTTQYAETYELIKTIANPPPVYWHSKRPDYQQQMDQQSGLPVAKQRIDKNKKNDTFGQEVSVDGNMGINGPLYLGVHQFNFISQKEAHMIMGMIEHGHRIHPDVALKKKGITARLHGLIKIKGARNYDDPAYNLGFHLLAALAKKVANHVNANPDTNQFFKDILERSNMIQVKTSTVATKPTPEDPAGGVAFNQFTVIYPPVFDGKIELNADTNYMATRPPIGSGLAFKIP